MDDKDLLKADHYSRLHKGGFLFKKEDTLIGDKSNLLT